LLFIASERNACMANVIDQVRRYMDIDRDVWILFHIILQCLLQKG